MKSPALLLLAITLAACVSTPPPGRTADAARPYRLPFEAGTTRLCVQGGPGPLSHSGSQRYAVDFAMPAGTPVLAARDGVVVHVKEDSDRGGPNKAFAADGNRIRVRHEDGTVAVYLHLRKDGAIVEPGTRVRRGQTIGYSGNTGWSAMPHLHFQVNRDGSSIPVAFEDVKGDGVPKMLMWYESGNRP